MNKNLKLSFLFTSITAGVIMSWNTLSSFFGGVGVNYVTLLAVLAGHIFLLFTDSYVKSRTKDMFIISTCLTGLEFLIYFVYEFSIGDTKTIKVFSVFQMVFTILGIFYFAYVAFRFISEFKNVKFPFIEKALGNTKKEKAPKKSKEFANGSLSEKPSNSKFTSENDVFDEDTNKSEISLQNSAMETKK